MKTIEELRKEKAYLMEKRNKDYDRLIVGVRDEIKSMSNGIKLYGEVYSKIELLETLERWAQDLTCAEEVLYGMDNKVEFYNSVRDLVDEY